MDSNQPPPSPPPPPLLDEPPPPPPPTSPPVSNKSEKLDLNRPCKIARVNFEGVYRTRPKLLGKIVSDIFQARSLLDFLQRSAQIRENLLSLNAFSNVELEVKPAEDGGDINEELYDVTFVLEERGRLVASAKTAVDSHSTHLNLQIVLPNLNGIGDDIQLSSKFNKQFYSGECRYSVPLKPWRNLWNPNYSMSYSQYQWDSLPSGIDQEDKSIINKVDFYSLSQLKHSISFENIWRYIKSSSLKTPVEIREQSGHSIKSSLKHSMTWDNRLGGNFPYEGMTATLSNEFTTNLVTGGARFTRHEASVQFNQLLLPKYDLIFQMNLTGGTLFRANKINICDKFFAGGPLTLRGFQLHGLAPTRSGCPLGKSSFLSAGAHLYPILPYTTPESPINDHIRPHVFFNSGTLGDLNDLGRLHSRADIHREILRFKDSLRHSCGFGLVMYFLNLRLEVNYCLPLAFKGGDLHMRGVQWGFGLNYT